MGVVLEVRVFPLIAAVSPMGEYSAVGMAPLGNLRELVTPKIRSATVADGFVRLPPNDRDLGNASRAG